MEEDVTLRHSTAVRQHRQNVVRTPTAVVSEVFGFLNDVPSMMDDDELVMSDGEVDKLFSNLDVTSCDEAGIEDHGDLLLNGCDSDKYLADMKSKDSGFASLERQRCENGALFNSFLEDDEETEDAAGSVYANDIIRSISESLYDDVDVSNVPRSISMDLKSTCVDDETEDAIASLAEQFGLEYDGSKCGSGNAISLPEMNCSDDIADKHSIESKGEGHITITLIETPFVDKDGVTNQTYESVVQVGADAAVGSDVAVVASDDYSKISMENVIVIENEVSPGSILNESVLYLVTQKPELGTEFDFVIEPGESTIAQGGVADSYCYAADGILSGNIFDYELKADVDTMYESCGVDNDDNAGNEIIRAVVCSTSLDDNEDEEEDDVKDSDSTSSACEQAYDTIDMEACPIESGSEVVQGKQVDLNHSIDHGSDTSSICTTDSTTPMSDKSPSNMTKRQKLEKNPSVEMVSDDTSDEDVGVYAESFRRSNWIRLSQQGKLAMNAPDMSPSQPRSSPLVLAAAGDIGSSSTTDNVDGDEVFNDPLTQAAALAGAMHKRTDSMTTTASETEFKFQYVSRRKCLIQRAESQQEYHRLSSRVYDQDKQIIIQRSSESEDLGLHLLNSHPAFITSIDPGSAADKAGLTEGLILVSVNDQNVLTTDHADIVQLIQSLKGDIKLGVANSDFQPVRDIQAIIMSGYMSKLGNSAFKIWKKRYFVLRQDNCLYYYKNEQETDPLGALPLGGYTISRHTETSKDFCFKAEKYGGRTYYFIADNRDQMTEWVGALTEAAARSKKRKESFLSVSSHNVGLPALHIVQPECAGFLGKLSPSNRAWRRRYCILKNACLYYYKDKNSVSALGVAHFHGYTVDAENYNRRKHSFSLQPPEKKMRVFSFSADNDTDKKRWVESLIHSIQRWVRVDREAGC